MSNQTHSALVRGEDGGIHVRRFATAADAAAACAAHETPIAPQMTEAELDRLEARRERRNAEREARALWTAHHRKFYSPLFPPTLGTSDAVFSHSAAQAHKPKLVHGNSF